METVRQLYKLGLNGASLREAFTGYFKAGLFTDCQIVSRCGKGLGVHKAILSSCSNYFAKLFLLRNSENPIIVFPNLVFGNLKKVIEYIYIGEVTLEESELDGFMFTVDLLQIQGVTPRTPLKAQASSNDNLSTDSTSSSTIGSCSSSSSDTSDSSVGQEEVEFKIPMKTRQKNEAEKRPSQSRPKIKSKISRKGDDDSKTDDKGTHRCGFCHKPFTTRRSIQQHERVCPQNPNRIILKCSACDRTFTRNSRRNDHFEKAHKTAGAAKVSKPLDAPNKAEEFC